jgi:ketosteroid isomerase-like protein
VSAVRSNLELTREAWRVMQQEGVTGLLSRYNHFFTEDLEWRPPITDMTGEPYIGRSGYERYVADVREILGEIHGQLEEVAEIAPDAVRVKVHVQGEGTRSGAPVDAPMIMVTRFRSGRVCWGWGSYDLGRAELLADAITRGEEVSV